MNLQNTWPSMTVTDGWKPEDYLSRIFDVLHVSLARGHAPAEALRRLANGAASHLDGLNARSWQNRIRMIAGDLEEGKPLSEALRRHVHGFMPGYMLQAVTVAEERHLERDILLLLRQQIRPGKGLRQRVQEAMTLPALELCAMLAVGGVIAVFIMPRFARLYDEILPGFPVPLPTALFIQMWRIIHTISPLLILIPVLLLVAALLDALFANCRAFFRSCLIRLVRFWPWFGKAFRASQLGTVADMISAFITAGEDVPEAVGMAATVTTDKRLREELERARDAMLEGMDWADAWENAVPDGDFGNWTIRNAASLDGPVEGFQAFSAFYQRQNSHLLNMGLRRLELTCLLINSGLTAFVALALYTPLVTTITQIY